MLTYKLADNIYSVSPTCEVHSLFGFPPQFIPVQTGTGMTISVPHNCGNCYIEIMTDLPVIQDKKIKTLIFQRMNCSFEQIQDFCQRWKIAELAIFGSILRDDFNPDSDIDFLVKFTPDMKIGLMELYEIEEQLTKLVGRPIDLVFKTSIEKSHNWIRRQNILETAEVIYGTR